MNLISILIFLICLITFLIGVCFIGQGYIQIIMLLHFKKVSNIPYYKIASLVVAVTVIINTLMFLTMRGTITEFFNSDPLYNMKVFSLSVPPLFLIESVAFFCIISIVKVKTVLQLRNKQERLSN